MISYVMYITLKTLSFELWVYKKKLAVIFYSN